MSIRTEGTSTNEILRDARFHYAAVESDSNARSLGDAVAQDIAALKGKRNASEDAEEQRLAALAALLRSDFDLDAALRATELEVLGAVAKNRAAAQYKAVFPQGLSALIRLRGADEAREVRASIGKLKEAFPEIAAAHAAELDALAQASIDAEQAWKDSETQAARVFADEVIARTELVRQLQKNEGALTALYPGERARVRSYFRPTRRRGAVQDDSGESSPPAA